MDYFYVDISTELGESLTTYVQAMDETAAEYQARMAFVNGELEATANRGFMYLQDKWDNENYIFSSPFVLVDILSELPSYNQKTLDVVEK